MIMIHAMHEFFLQPFIEFGFMRRALVACVALGLAFGPVGTLLVLRRMSLAGDAISHAVLPGAAIGYILVGVSLPAMGIGGFIAAALMAMLASGVARWTSQKEDSSLAAFYLIALALGVLLISLNGSSIDLLHLLFGSVLALDTDSLILITATTSVTWLVLAIIWRPLLIECFDPVFLKSANGHGALMHQLFMLLVVLNLVAAFQALGTLMAVGLMMLPATAACYWTHDSGMLAAVSSIIGAFSGAAGLLLSYHANLPSGPAIVLVAGVIYLISLLIGTRDSLRLKWWPMYKHREN